MSNLLLTRLSQKRIKKKFRTPIQKKYPVGAQNDQKKKIIFDVFFNTLSHIFIYFSHFLSTIDSPLGCF